IRKASKGSGSLFRPLVWAVFVVVLIVFLGGATAFTYYYVKYSRMIDERLAGPVFPDASQIYAAPVKLRVGQAGNVSDIILQLQAAGFSKGGNAPSGHFELVHEGIKIYPGPDSYYSDEPAELDFTDDKLGSIVSLKDQFARDEFSLEPQLITNL